MPGKRAGTGSRRSFSQRNIRDPLAAADKNSFFNSNVRRPLMLAAAQTQASAPVPPPPGGGGGGGGGYGYGGGGIAAGNAGVNQMFDDQLAYLTKTVGGGRQAIENAGSDLTGVLGGLATDSRHQFNAANRQVRGDFRAARREGRGQLDELQADLERQGVDVHALAAEAAYQQRALRDQALTQRSLQTRLGQTFNQDLGNRSALGSSVTTGALDALTANEAQAKFGIEQQRQEALQALAAAAARGGGRGGHGGGGGGYSSSSGAFNPSSASGDLEALGNPDFGDYFDAPEKYSNAKYNAARERTLDMLAGGKSAADVEKYWQQRFSQGAVGFRHRDILNGLNELVRRPPIDFQHLTPQQKAYLQQGYAK